MEKILPNLITDFDCRRYFFYDDAAQEAYMHDECRFDGAFAAWKRFRFGASRRDLFVLCVMYQEGGVFMDVEIPAVGPAREALQANETSACSITSDFFLILIKIDTFEHASIRMNEQFTCR